MRPYITITSIFIFIATFTLYVIYILKEDSSSLKFFPTIKTLQEPYRITDPNQRVIFTGDVHGKYTEFKDLIDNKLNGLDENTLLILLGDFMIKGPDSRKVVSYILEHKDQIKCVLGNNDILVLLAYLNPHLPLSKGRTIHSVRNPLNFTTDHSFTPQDISKISARHRQIAKEVGYVNLLALAQHCSVAIEVELELTRETLFGAHAGVLPGDFMDHGPHRHTHPLSSVKALTDMKYVDEDDWTHTSREPDTKHSIKWYKLWDEYGSLYKNVTVFYGHDSRTGLNLRKHTKGLDSGCAKGGELSAMEYKYNEKKGKYEHRLVQVDC
ncbi:putative serine/threonine-protein phosphatase NDAI_0F03700 [Naumovozyma dairenensis CBS 421]|uniref:Calcineurin-like phosphoesterase domain-containing protein n=1 Tax=Naumovozyma dairenensis (strain ATCC 10597 / BCRC 20456 / CBS 421 / NBRC 0211 / NRRL Y-12639) TaxID=1071378 RepID=G0WD27_NAUDC|nr:hypothetical protein NDAI_0F03700 [Naumovozyma dairenensis CBS 421]CCD25688.1 hypothetical protein NDAI_0F03700 [Naumovozyma dairenensis CBS 421]